MGRAVQFEPLNQRCVKLASDATVNFVPNHQTDIRRQRCGSDAVLLPFSVSIL